MKNKKTLQYVAGALFALRAIIPLVLMLNSGHYTIWSFLSPLGYFLIAISLFASLQFLTTFGAIVAAVNEIRNIIIILRIVLYVPESMWSDYIDYISIQNPKLFLAIEVAAVLYLLFLAICGLSRKAAKILGILSGVIRAISYVVSIGLGQSQLTPLGAVYVVLFVIGAILLGIAFSANEGKAAPAVGTVSAGSDKIEQLTRLKSLLDMGALTQEEFEEKKRQILGQ